MSGGQRSVQVAAIGDYPRLIESDPHRLSIVEHAENNLCVIGEPVGHVAVDPSAAIVDGRREVPVIQRDQRLDPVLPPTIGEPSVEIEPLFIDPSEAFARRREDGLGGVLRHDHRLLRDAQRRRAAVRGQYLVGRNRLVVEKPVRCLPIAFGPHRPNLRQPRQPRPGKVSQELVHLASDSYTPGNASS